MVGVRVGVHELAREASQPLVGGELLSARARLIRKAQLEPLVRVRVRARARVRVGVRVRVRVRIRVRLT